MKRTELALAFILPLLLSLTATLPIIREAKANPRGMASLTWKDVFHVQSPRGISNSDTVLLNFTVETLWQKRQTTYVLYAINTNKRIAEVDVTNAVVSKKLNFFSEYTSVPTYLLQYNVNITDLANGSYSLTVRTLGGETDSVSFTIKNTSVDDAEIPEFPSSLVLASFLVVGLTIVFLRKKAWVGFHE